MNTFAWNPIPRSTIVSGIHAIGGIGLIISKIGLTNLSTESENPIMRPRGIPIAIASRNPENDVIRLDTIFCPSVAPSGLAFESLSWNVATRSVGAGRYREATIPVLTTISHKRTKATNERIGNMTFCFSSSAVSIFLVAIGTPVTASTHISRSQDPARSYLQPSRTQAVIRCSCPSRHSLP